MSLNKEEILSVVYDDKTVNITEFNNKILKSSTNLIPNQINAGYGTTQSPGLKNILLGGYDGTGVRIGIIEAEGLRYNPTTPSLIVPDATGQLSYLNVMSVLPSKAHHPSLVTSIIVGQPTTYNNTVFEGIATGARVFQSSIITELELFQAFDLSDDNYVDVINISIQDVTNGNEYS